MFLKILFLLILISENCTAVQKSLRQKKANPEETFLLLKSMQVKLADQILSHDDTKRDNITDYDSDANGTSQNYLQTHSSCPWKLVKRFNGNRIPNTTIEAVCLSEKCSSPCNTRANAQNRRQLEEMTAPGCVPIKYFRWVQVLKGSGKNKEKQIKKKKKKTRYVYRLLPITVGCTCACSTVNKLT